MSSHQPISAPVRLAPKRRRGQLRVEAILAAANTTFAEKGYAATTMTEIAARSHTAIGSLYRFFPNKEVLAEALMSQYADILDKTLARIDARAADLAPRDLAAALVDLMIELCQDRAGVLALMETQGGDADKRLAVRNAMRQRIAAILVATRPGLPQARAEVAAIMVAHVLKTVPATSSEAGELHKALLDQVRTLLQIYLDEL